MCERGSFLACHNNAERRTHTYIGRKKGTANWRDSKAFAATSAHRQLKGERERERYGKTKGSGVSYAGSMELLLKVVQLR